MDYGWFRGNRRLEELWGVQSGRLVQAVCTKQRQRECQKLDLIFAGNQRVVQNGSVRLDLSFANGSRAVVPVSCLGAEGLVEMDRETAVAFVALKVALGRRHLPLKFVKRIVRKGDLGEHDARSAEDG